MTDGSPYALHLELAAGETPTAEGGGPLVSVIIPFLDEERFIDEAIQSVLTQTYDNWELILVDDGSTDRSTDIAARYAERYPHKVCYLEHEGHAHRGQAASRNLGIRHAKGEYIALLDADDVWLPHKLQRQLAVIRDFPDANLLCGASLYWRSWTGRPEDARSDTLVLPYGVESPTLLMPMQLLREAYPLGCAMPPCLNALLFRRSVVVENGGFVDTFVERRQIYEDQAFLSKMYTSGSVVAVPEFWDKYRLHQTSCVVTEREAGAYLGARVFFLRWLARYLGQQRITDPGLRRTIENSLRCCRDIRRQRRRHQLAQALARICGCATQPTRGWGSIRADPRHVRAHDVSGPAGTTLFWAASHSDALEIHVDAPDGPLLMVCTPAGSAATGPVIRGSAVFYLQDREGGQPLTSEHTLARVRVKVVPSSRARMRALTKVLRHLARQVLPAELRKWLWAKRNGVPYAPSRSLGEIGRGWVKGIARRILPAPMRHWVWAKRHGVQYTPPPGWVRFGSLRRLTPISKVWGCDRGRPIDRYYIERFLARHAEDVRGRVLEFGDSGYTQAFGGARVTQSDVMCVEQGNPQATVVADLANAPSVPSDAFDCIICTQVLQLIYDTRAALRTLHRILKPGGVLLATVSGISQIYDAQWGGAWCWNFTSRAVQRLFQEEFLGGRVEVEAHGNVLAAVSFLHGLAVHELTGEELDSVDPGYEVSIAVRAVKGGDGG